MSPESVDAAPHGAGPTDDRPTTRAEAATWWELRDELSEQILGLRRDTGEAELGFDDYVLRAPEQTDSDPGPAGPAGAARHESPRTAPPDRHLAAPDDIDHLQPPGARVALWRGRRGLSQMTVAHRLNRALAWVIAVEQDLDRLDTIEAARDVADVLRMDLPLLMGRDPHGPPDPGFIDEDTVEQLHAALEVSSDPLRLFPTGTRPLALVEMAVTLRATWQALQRAEYARVMRALPRLLRDAAISDGARAAGHDGAEAARLLSQTYQIASAVLVKAGLYELARLAADRAFEAAGRGEDPLLLGTSAGCGAAVLMALGRPAPALELSVLAADSIRRSHQAGVSSLSVRGLLLAQGALAAARTGDEARAEDLLTTADTLAGMVCPDANYYWTAYNRAAVHLRRLAIAVELGREPPAADPSRLATATPEQRATYHVTLARAHLQTGHLDRAADALLASTGPAPDELLTPLSQTILTDVLRQSHRAGTPVPPRLERLLAPGR
ncbi:transcriptional regulator with XRE-family HTH domain [Actinoplanes octamycinicus]|uniref:Transcriptional regulator with XRE-family HTH domain n=1 Tax=Actinoplanes octamycinicus TaxID=135948 RepID=A0A7W7H7F6_9ACTN|nr:helix-turn-helix domain-containing protein [Actinoplanes octamycinicus]MBB4745268.1 transcriptional regulator with XRE-family HTH domain [Actinoplanes octamycinicus]GIE62254.1 hypothetical protein Aoc01nite_76560 [Actinoplanes octamycinicus]